MNKIKILLNVALISLLIFWIAWTSALVIDEFTQWDICPTLLSIPACYIILWAFITLFVLHLLKINKYYFYAIASIPIAIAAYGTFFQIFGGIECPKTDWGIPMCFISLSLFSSITFLKYVFSKLNND